MFYHHSTSDNEHSKIKVHIDDDDFKGVNDLDDWPIVVQFDRLNVYLNLKETEKLADLLNAAIIDLSLRPKICQ